MKYFSPLMPFSVGWAVLLITNSFASISLINGALQMLLFALVVCIPAWRTGRMSYVDIGWPWGLTVIGILTWIYSEGDSTRVALVSIAYIFAGSRMGLGALKMWKMGLLKKNFPGMSIKNNVGQKQGNPIPRWLCRWMPFYKAWQMPPFWRYRPL